MVNSMTGFGRGEAEGLGYHFSLEIKGVNSRFLEVVVKIPKNLIGWEERVRKIIQDKVSRGRIEVYINIKETGEKKRFVKVDKDLSLAYDNSLKELANLLNTAYQTDIYRLITLPEVISIEEAELDTDSLWPLMEKALDAALAELLEMRRLEGQKLVEDLLQKLSSLDEIRNEIAVRAPLVVSEYRRKLKEKLALLLNDTGIDETRLNMEIALFADRASIEEELVRLASHLEQFKSAVFSSGPVGRKLDFLVQEMNREINTIGSKANDLEISKLVVEGKSELEKIREQIQNIE
ncbi:MAG TPA: YicC family protein [Peptococcaceae bacterium]|nr:YicC family protein [Peptococcaceae bacterium]